MTTIKNESVPPAKSTGKEADRAPSPWEAIVVGSKVLARSTEPGETGYYLSLVTEVSADKQTLTLKWVGAEYAKLPSFKARRLAVGILAKG